MKINRKSYIIMMAAGLGMGILPSCVDDVVTPTPPEEEIYVDPNIPEEIRNGYSITFNMSLPPLGGEGGSRTTNEDLLNIDNFIDLEKVRILFFVCAKEVGNTAEADTAYTKYYNYKYGNEENKPYMAGTNDHFLFESKSRWVAELTSSESNSANWQVTAPVFTYGNNDEYRWEDIRYALTNYPFKVVVMANRPDEVDFKNFDSKFKDGDKDIEVKYNTGRGPMWGPEDTWIPPERRTADDKAKGSDFWKKKPIINDLHHCQWDVVYTSKNSGDKNTYACQGVYDFIMKNPDHDPTHNSSQALSMMAGNMPDVNWMGALSNWTTKKTFGDNVENAYFHPNKQTQAIPMYGVQVFDPIPDWQAGTPYNISDRHHGQSGQLIRKNIYLLRSLVKLELKIPKQMQNSKKEWVDVEIQKPYLKFSNVMSRCEPLDVATPTERLWHDENTSLNEPCEWENIYAYGPILTDKNAATGTVDQFQRIMAWFYGAWRDWWDFNVNYNDNEVFPLPEGNLSSYFNLNTKVLGKPYPRIYNPVIQRNEKARIDYCLVEDEAFYYYVIYTGERNISDPSYFGETDYFLPKNAHMSFFSFNITTRNSITGKVDEINDKTYSIPLAGFEPGSLSARTHIENEGFSDYKKEMGESDDPKDWNWPLLRNHCYTFTVRSIGTTTDSGGIDVKVVSTEKRTAPNITFF